LSGLQIGALVSASQDRLRPRPLAITEILEDVAGLVDLTPLDERRITGIDPIRWMV